MARVVVPLWRTAAVLLLISSPCLSLVVQPALLSSLRASRCAVNRRGGVLLHMTKIERAGNATDVPQTFRLRGMRPKGVGDEIENILQGPTSEEYDEENGPEWLDPAMFNQYNGDEGKTPDRPPTESVGGKIGLEKQVGIPEEGGSFGMASRQPMSGADRIRADEERLVGASQEGSFLAAIAGTVLVGAVYFSLSGGGLSLPQYGAGAPDGQVVERFEEAFVCYGIPSPDDPSGCKDSRSVGRVRILSPAVPPGGDGAASPAAESAPASQ